MLRSKILCRKTYIESIFMSINLEVLAVYIFRAGPVGLPSITTVYPVSCHLSPVCLSVEKNVKNSSLVTNRAKEV